MDWNLIFNAVTAVGGLALAVAQFRAKQASDKRDVAERERREQEAKLLAAREALEQERHKSLLEALRDLKTGQAETRDEIRKLHERDAQLAVELERRAARIEGHLGLHGRPSDVPPITPGARAN